MKESTLLLATWSDGLFAVTGDGYREEIADLCVRGLVPDGRGSVLAIVGGNSLRRWRQAASGRPLLPVSSNFRAVWLLETQSTLERMTRGMPAAQ